MQLQDLPFPVFLDELIVVFSGNPEGRVLLGGGLRIKDPVGVGPKDVPLAPGMGAVFADLDHGRGDGQHQQQKCPVRVGVGHGGPLLDGIAVGIHPACHGIPDPLHMLLAEIRAGIHDLHAHIRIGVGPEIVPDLSDLTVLHIKDIPAHEVLDIHRIGGIGQTLDLLFQ